MTTLSTRQHGLDRHRPEPLYYQLDVALRGRILSGEWRPGTQIPTEEHLSRLYGVSRITVRRALQNLVGNGYLERGQGRGTFVREPVLVVGERGLRSFSEEMQALELDPGSRVLEATEVPARGTVAERLGLAQGAAIHRVKRLRTGNGKPVGVQTAHLSVERFPNLGQHLGEGASLYELLRGFYGVELDYARETFTATLAEAGMAPLLDVAVGDPVFGVERVAFDTGGPLEYTVSVMRGDRYRIQWVLRNKPSTLAPQGGLT